MRTLIRDVTAITLDEWDRILNNVDIAIDGQQIVAVGEAPPDFAPDEVLDGHDRIALPGFFSAHAHAAMTLERGFAEDLPFDRWLNEKIWVAESALEEEDVYWGTALACCESIRSGMVGFADHYFWMDQVARAVDEAGMKANLAWCQFGTEVVKEVGGITLEDTLRFVREWHGAAGGRIRCSVGPHSPYMCPTPFLERTRDEAGALGVGLHLHVAESEAQVDTSYKTFGKSPVVYLNDLGLFDLPTPAIAAHCIAVDDRDIAILAEKGAGVAHAPKTYLKLAMGVAPLPKMLDAGVHVAMGTDGPASSSDLNLLEQMRIAGLYHKNALGRPEALPNTQLLRLATKAGAQALGFADSGTLAAGQRADLVLFDTRAPHWYPRHDLAAGIVYTAHPSDISHVFVDGKCLLRDGELLTLDEERICYEAERRAFRMVGTPMRRMRSRDSA